MAETGTLSQAARSGEQVLANSGSLGAGSTLQVLLWLGFIIALILAIAWLVRRFSGINAGGTGVIRVLTAISLGTRDRIALIQAGDKQILLGISPGRINTLHVFDEPVLTVNDTGPGGPPGSGSNEFARKLQELLGKTHQSTGQKR